MLRMVKRPRRATKLFPATAALATIEPDESLLLDAAHIDGYSVRDCGICLQVTLGKFGSAPFAAKIRVPKGLAEAGIRAFVRTLINEEESIVAYLDAASNA